MNREYMNMDILFKKVLIIIVSAAVVAPTAFVLYHYMSVSDQASDPLAYIPSNSTLVAGINYNGTKMYAFYESGTPSIMIENAQSLLDLNTSSIAGVSNSSNTSSLTSGLGIGFSTWGIVHGFQIYRIKINETRFGAINSKFPSFMEGYLKDLESNLSLNLYAYNPYGFSFVVGSLNSLNNSINAYAGGENFVSRSAYLSSLSNLSFYISGSNHTLFRSVTGNVTMNSTQVYFNMASESKGLHDIYNISRQWVNLTNFSAVWNTPLQLEIKLGIGMGIKGNILQLFNLTGMNQSYFATYQDN